MEIAKVYEPELEYIYNPIYKPIRNLKSNYPSLQGGLTVCGVVCVIKRRRG